MPTPVRAIRIADDLWADVEAIAEAEHVDVSTVVRNALSAYVRAAGVLLVAFLALVFLSGCGGAQAPAAAPNVAVTDPCDSATSRTIQIAGPRGFITSDEWCARLSQG